MSNLEVWWSAYLAAIAAGENPSLCRAIAESALDDFLKKERELNEQAQEVGEGA